MSMNFWLVVSNMTFIFQYMFHFIYGMSSFPIDELIFFKIVKTTNQMSMNVMIWVDYIKRCDGTCYVTCSDAGAGKAATREWSPKEPEPSGSLFVEMHWKIYWTSCVPSGNRTSFPPWNNPLTCVRRAGSKSNKSRWPKTVLVLGK